MLDFHRNKLRTLVRWNSDRTINALYTYTYVIRIPPSRLITEVCLKGHFICRGIINEEFIRGHIETVPSAFWHFVTLSRECPD